MQAVRGNVGEVINEKDQRGQREQLLKDLDLEQVRPRPPPPNPPPQKK